MPKEYKIVDNKQIKRFWLGHGPKTTLWQTYKIYHIMLNPEISVATKLRKAKQMKGHSWAKEFTDIADKNVVPDAYIAAYFEWLNKDTSRPFGSLTYGMDKSQYIPFARELMDNIANDEQFNESKQARIVAKYKRAPGLPASSSAAASSAFLPGYNAITYSTTTTSTASVQFDPQTEHEINELADAMFEAQTSSQLHNDDDDALRQFLGDGLLDEDDEDDLLEFLGGG
ncbi:MAG TPA: hypothetical protein VLG38_00580, partial [Gammaproteobacteria bacterium]|nr:hypothetical protein [Gammaproteobacteria bacterium]